jgi:hypothetical protein
MLLFIGFIGLGRSNKGDTLHCASCEQLLGSVDDICRVMGRPPRKTYVNPHGVVCPILTLAHAVSLAEDTYSSTEHTWFEGYAWRPVACGSCGLFLGWRFEAVSGGRPPDFYGLLEERLVSREGPGDSPS